MVYLLEDTEIVPYFKVCYNVCICFFLWENIIAQRSHQSCGASSDPLRFDRHSCSSGYLRPLLKSHCLLRVCLPLRVSSKLKWFLSQDPFLGPKRIAVDWCGSILSGGQSPFCHNLLVTSLVVRSHCLNLWSLASSESLHPCAYAGPATPKQWLSPPYLCPIGQPRNHLRCHPVGSANQWLPLRHLFGNLSTETKVRQLYLKRKGMQQTNDLKILASR